MKKFLVIALVFFLNIGADYDEFMKDFYFLGQDKQSNKLYEGWAKTAYIFTDIIKMERFSAKVYGDTPADIKARRATLKKDNSDIQLQEDVHVESEDRTLQTEQLDWQPKENIATTDKDVLITQKDLSINARGLRQDMAEKKMHLEKDIKVAFQNDSTFTYINCDGPMEIDYQQNQAVLHNNVKVSDPQGEIYADTMTLYFEPEGKTINRVHAVGNVKIVREDSTTYAEEANYSFKTQKLTLQGSPRVLIVTEDRQGNETP